MWVMNESFSSCIMPPTFSNPYGQDFSATCVTNQHFLLLETLELGFRNTRPLLFSSFLSAFRQCFLFSTCFLIVNICPLSLQPLIFSSYLPRAILHVLPITCIRWNVPFHLCSPVHLIFSHLVCLNSTVTHLKHNWNLPFPTWKSPKPWAACKFSTFIYAVPSA